MASAPAVNGEVKEQLAVDAAADPNSSVTAQQAEKVILDESKKAGAVAMQFDPDASPEEKAAQAKAVRSSILPATVLTILTYKACQRYQRLTRP